MISRPTLSLFLAGCLACAGSNTEEAPAEPATAPIAETEVAPTEEPTGNVFGDPLSDRETTPLATIAAAPDEFAGQVVKTEGEITQVCQRMGCWMEMRSEGAPAIRVPMAGHSFFLPKDVAGRHAVIEGEVAVRELSDGEREHLASEGAQAVASALQISATGVVLR